MAAGGASRTRVRDRSRAAGKRAHGIAAKLRMRSAQGKDEAHAVVKRITGELAELAAEVFDSDESGGRKVTGRPPTTAGEPTAAEGVHKTAH